MRTWFCWKSFASPKWVTYLESLLRGQHLVEQDAQGPPVHTPGVRVVEDDLRRHVICPMQQPISAIPCSCQPMAACYGATPGNIANAEPIYLRLQSPWPTFRDNEQHSPAMLVLEAYTRTGQRFATATKPHTPGVPQNVRVLASPNMPSLHIPKSASFTCPRLSSSTLSSLRSRYTTPMLWRNSSARTISAA